jgi:hypothetical protein
VTRQKLVKEEQRREKQEAKRLRKVAKKAAAENEPHLIDEIAPESLHDLITAPSKTSQSPS